MRPDERRQLIIEHLNYKRHDTYQHLADEFGVSWLTVYRDMKYLEVEYPLKITRGVGGGVALREGYYIKQKRLTKKQADALRHAIPLVSEDDCEALKSILYAFAG